MGTCFFFSGFDNEKGFSPEIAQSLQERIMDRKSLVFVASCPFGHEKTDFYKDVCVHWFRNIGIEFERVDVIDGRKTETECAAFIKNVSAIFLAGGTTLAQMDFLRKNNLAPLLKQFNGAMMGMSAGAINMAVNAFYSADKDCGQTHIYKGIGLSDISIEPHFSLDNAKLLEKDILPFSQRIDIYCMCDNSAIMVQDGKRQYYGDIYLASKGNIQKIN